MDYRTMTMSKLRLGVGWPRRDHVASCSEAPSPCGLQNRPMRPLAERNGMRWFTPKRIDHIWQYMNVYTCPGICYGKQDDSQCDFAIKMMTILTILGICVARLTQMSLTHEPSKLCFPHSLLGENNAMFTIPQSSPFLWVVCRNHSQSWVVKMTLFYPH
jgi:hypothetical protein